MNRWHKSLQDRWSQFTFGEQILMIANELNRANNNLKYPEEYSNSLERALELIDFCSSDLKLNSNLLKELRRARMITAQLYVKKIPQETQQLQNQLLGLSSKCWNLFERARI